MNMSSEQRGRLRAEVADAPSDPHARVALARLLGALGNVHEALDQLAIATSLATDPIAADSVVNALTEVTAAYAGTWRLPHDPADDAPREPNGRRPAVAGLDHARPGPTESGGAVPVDGEATHLRAETHGGLDDDALVMTSTEMAEFTVANVTLFDIAGLADVKSHIETRVLAPIRQPELAARYGQRPSGGVLLWGPPGCGKTLVAKALAGTLELSFGAASMSDLLDAYIGSSERNVTRLFREARRHAPCVLFFDEVDAVGGRRSTKGHHVTSKSVVSQLLIEMDGVDTRATHDVFVVAATDAPWDVDPALRRPGRFDRSIFVPPPDLDARVAILAAELVRAPLAGVDLQKIARQLRGRSGADVRFVAAAAIESAYEHARRRDEETPVTMDHLNAAVGSTHPTIDEWVAVAKIAADASDDAEIWQPFIDWHRSRSRRGR